MKINHLFLIQVVPCLLKVRVYLCVEYQPQKVLEYCGSSKPRFSHFRMKLIPINNPVKKLQHCIIHVQNILLKARGEGQERLACFDVGTARAT